MPDALVLTPLQLLDHWQGHRRLTRRVIEAFPSDEAFATFTIGAMRPASTLVSELLNVGVPTLRGLATGEWQGREQAPPSTRADALAAWDADTAELDRLWATLSDDAFQTVATAFGQWEGPGHWLLLYGIDNEVHHRGQLYVYLRALGVEPPPFYER